MFATSLTLKNYSNVDTVFNKLSSSNTESVFLDASTTLSAPRRLSIKHQMAKDGVVGRDRHLVQVATTKLDAANNPKQVIINISVQADRAVITRSDVDDALALAKNALGTTGLVTQLLNGEV